jgi:hypothetical protein
MMIRFMVPRVARCCSGSCWPVRAQASSPDGLLFFRGQSLGVKLEPLKLIKKAVIIALEHGKV